MREKSRTIYRLIVIATCVAFLTMCSWITFPFVVSFSLQLFAVFLICGCFSPTISVSAVALYILLGLIGAPVFSGFSSGSSAFAGASGGFILSFVLVSIIISAFRKYYSKNIFSYVLTMSVSLIVCYICGTVWYMYVFSYPSPCSVGAALTVCVLPFIIFDAIKILLAALALKKLQPFINKLPL